MENIDLLTKSYNYELDANFIADRPVPGRHHSKLMVYDQENDQVIHTSFQNISEFLPAKSLVVLNESKVFPCRLLGEKTSGGKAELFLLSLLRSKHGYPAMIKSRGKKKLGDKFLFGNLEATITRRGDEGDFYIEFNISDEKLLMTLEEMAHIPIPPYIRDGIADEKDREDYQTVYAKELGSVAAPTAGLHFTEKVFESLAAKNIDKAFVTLHVGAGTFKPVNSDNILEHRMHSELFRISKDNLNKLNQAQNIFAVGTTSLRVLESSYKNEKFYFDQDNGFSETSIFLYPGVPVNSIRGLITNFHLPQSTLLMLVSALIGREKTLELYEIAKENKYRFFSYGDAMLILRGKRS